MASAAACAAPMTLAQRPLTVIVPFAAGTPVDAWTRVVVERLAGRLGQPVIVDNRAGHFGWIGTQAAARAAPDGTTLLVLNGATLSRIFFRSPPLEVLEVFRPVGAFYRGRHILFGAPKLEGSLPEVLARARAKPGALRYGYASANTRLVMERLKRIAATPAIDDIPYKSVGQIAIGLMAGDVDLAVDSAGTYRALVAQGKVRALATVADTRDPLLPEVPTAREVGLAVASPGFSGGFWVPARTPQDVLGRMASAVREVLSAPQVQQTLAAAGAQAVVASPEEFLAMVKAERAYWAQAANEAGYVPE